MKKLQEYIKHIKTMLYKMMLCVSLRKKGSEKFVDCEKSGKFENKNNKNDKNMKYDVIDKYYTEKKYTKIKKTDFIFSQDEVLSIFATSFNNIIKKRNFEKQKITKNKIIRTL